MAADDPLKERFEILRRRARQAAASESQREAEGLKRRFAQIGQVGSGAQIRAEAQASKRGAERLARAEETVGLAELAERQRAKEVAEAREFARGERQASQTFAAQQAALGREFARGERLGSQTFAAGQADLQRKFQTGERISSQDWQRLENEAGRTFSKEERIAAQNFANRQGAISRAFTAGQNALARALQREGLDLQRDAFDEGVRQFDKEFARDTDTIEFNKKMAEETLNRTLFDDLGLSGIFDGFGNAFSGSSLEDFFQSLMGQSGGQASPTSVTGVLGGVANKAKSAVTKATGGLF